MKGVTFHNLLMYIYPTVLRSDIHFDSAAYSEPPSFGIWSVYLARSKISGFDCHTLLCNLVSEQHCMVVTLHFNLVVDLAANNILAACRVLL